MKKIILSLIFLTSGIPSAWAESSVSIKQLNDILAANNRTVGNCRDLQVKVAGDIVVLESTSAQNKYFQTGQTLMAPASENIPVQITNLPNGVRELKIESTHKDIGRRQGDLMDHKIKRHDITYLSIGSGDTLLNIEWEAYEKLSIFGGWESLGGRRPFCE